MQRARPGMGWSGVGDISGRATSMPRRNSWANQRDQKESWVVGCRDKSTTLLGTQTLGLKTSG